MKKIVGLLVGIVAIVGLVQLLRYKPSAISFNNGVVTSTSSTPVKTPAPAPTQQDTPPATSSSPAPTTTTTTGFKDGNYTGDTIDVGYGPVQVAVTIKGGQITAVQFLQTPYDRSYSRQVAEYAKPILTKETIQAQSAHVSLVTGATATSEGFVQSLQSALTRAS